MGLAAILILTAIAELYFFSLLGAKMFPGSSSVHFPSNDAYIAHTRRQQLFCREQHLIEACVVGLTAGLITCWWISVSPTMLFAMFGAFEATWLFLTYVVNPQDVQTYNIPEHFLGAANVAFTVGVFSVLAGVSFLPLLLGAVFFLIGYALLMPM
jgi:hypothetical protein